MTFASANVSLAIIECGLITSVGHDADAAAAAVRAGVSRPAAMPEYEVLDLAAAQTVPLTGHPIRPITDGFVGTARWLQMAPLAFANLVTRAGLPSGAEASFWGRTCLILLTPRLEDRRFEYDARTRGLGLEAAYVTPLLKHLPRTLLPKNVLLVTEDRMGLPRVLTRCHELLTERKVDRVIVLAVDSLLDLYALGELGDTGRIKSDLAPTGLVPGECAATLLLEHHRGGSAGAGQGWAIIRSVAVHLDEPWDPSPEVRSGLQRGQALAKVLRATLGSGPGEVYTDLNGELWRSKEFGTSLVHMGARSPVVHHTASEVGDVATASSTLNTILAARALRDGYASAEQVAVSVSRATGGVGALCLARTQGGG